MTSVASSLCHVLCPYHFFVSLSLSIYSALCAL